MIKTNSKKAIENIKSYIMENYSADSYNEDSEQAKAKSFEEIAAVILKDVKRVKGADVNQYSRYTWGDAFIDWAQGLPGLLDTCYYYNRSAADDLAGILEETEEEKARYEERAAEKMLSSLIFRELTKAAGEVLY